MTSGPGWALRHGSYQQVLDGVVADAMVTDPPYGRRCHEGQLADRREQVLPDAVSSVGLGYPWWSWAEAMDLVDFWCEHEGRQELLFRPNHGWVRGWSCILTSHDLYGYFEQRLMKRGRYPFAPVPCVMPGMNCRLQGDGPSSWSVQLLVARPRCKPYSTWGTTPGAYVGKVERGMLRPGAKPLWLMRAIIRDYTRPGDLVVDPCAGSGTTLLAAVLEGRRAIGAEADYDAFVTASTRLYDAGGVTTCETS